MNRCPNISEHGLIGDLQTAALVTTEGTIEGAAADGGSLLKIMYRVDGSSDLTEEILGHFEGWRGSRPTRIGNGAADHLQLDIYGEAADALLAGDDDFISPTDPLWLSTLDGMDKELVSDSLVYRYNPAASPDGSTGEQLGNFPQAFTHLSLINAAITLNRELDKRASLYQPVPELAAH